MGFDMRTRIALLIAAAVGWLLVAVLYFRPRQVTAPGRATTTTAALPRTTSVASSAPDTNATSVYAHNLMLRQGPTFRFYVRWLRGQMVRTNHNVNPSFDEPGSFYLNVQSGILRANIGDLTNALNGGGLTNSPLKNVAITGDGDHITMKATLHKVVPLPIQMDGTLSAASNNRVQIHVTKLSVLKVPFKWLLGDLHISIADLFHPQGVPGIQVVNNDLFFDTGLLMPPPHFRGQLTQVRIANPDIEEVFGNAQTDINRVEQWRNFIHLRNGTINFGRLTMNNVDLIMIDISQDAWFDLDLSNYQAQLVNGYTRMTPQAGLQIFMPDLKDLPKTKKPEDINIEWMKNRNQPAPANVIKKQ